MEVSHEFLPIYIYIYPIICMYIYILYLKNTSWWYPHWITHWILVLREHDKMFKKIKTLLFQSMKLPWNHLFQHLPWLPHLELRSLGRFTVSLGFWVEKPGEAGWNPGFRRLQKLVLWMNMGDDHWFFEGFCIPALLRRSDINGRDSLNVSCPV